MSHNILNWLFILGQLCGCPSLCISAKIELYKYNSLPYLFYYKSEMKKNNLWTDWSQRFSFPFILPVVRFNQHYWTVVWCVCISPNIWIHFNLQKHHSHFRNLCHCSIRLTLKALQHGWLIFKNQKLRYAKTKIYVFKLHNKLDMLFNSCF